MRDNATVGQRLHKRSQRYAHNMHLLDSLWRLGLAGWADRGTTGWERRAPWQLAHGKLREEQPTGGSDDGGRPSLAMSPGEKLLCDEVKRLGESDPFSDEDEKRE